MRSPHRRQTAFSVPEDLQTDRNALRGFFPLHRPYGRKRQPPGIPPGGQSPQTTYRRRHVPQTHCAAHCEEAAPHHWTDLPDRFRRWQLCSRQRGKMVVKNLRMFPLLICCEAEDCLHNGKAVLFCAGSRDCIAVPRLALSCKRPHQILSCFACTEICCHSHKSFLYMEYCRNAADPGRVLSCPDVLSPAHSSAGRHPLYLYSPEFPEYAKTPDISVSCRP